MIHLFTTRCRDHAHRCPPAMPIRARSSASCPGDRAGGRESEGRAHDEVRQLPHPRAGGVHRPIRLLSRQDDQPRHRSHGEGAQQHRNVAEIQLVERHDTGISSTGRGSTPWRPAGPSGSGWMWKTVSFSLGLSWILPPYNGSAPEAEKLIRGGYTKKVSPWLFFHPDCTVGSGISPGSASPQGKEGSRAVPPVGIFTLP